MRRGANKTLPNVKGARTGRRSSLHRYFTERVDGDRPRRRILNQDWFQAQCSCGYKGDKRWLRVLADNDAQTHLTSL